MDTTDINTCLTPAVDYLMLNQWLLFWHTYRVHTFLLLGLSIAWIAFRHHKSRARPIEVQSPGTEEKSVWLQDQKAGSNFVRDDADSAVPTESPSLSSHKVRPAAARVVTGRKPVQQKEVKVVEQENRQIKPLVFFASLTTTTERLAKSVASVVEKTSKNSHPILSPEVLDLSYIDLDDYFISGPKTASEGISYFYILLLPSYDIDTILNNFIGHLDETHNDFRIDTAPLSNLVGYSVFGTGDKEGWPSEEKGRKRAYPLGMGDVKSNVNETLEEWTKGVIGSMQDISSTGTLGEGVPGSGDAIESGDEADETEDFPDSGRRKRQKTTPLADLEDVGGKPSKSPLAIDFTTSSSTPPTTTATLKPMVPTNSPTYTALTKQGYTIIGTHSGVKICRWTKSALRGRGSCYKNSFYGIASHLCMETTPSLSCSNKCVFCWRHGTNPVSTTWRWSVDPPDLIFSGAKAAHYKKIKMLRGVPGVRAERFEEAMRIRHCALSLVGEPIFYPHINEFVSLLHSERISSFLVCNAQHPTQLDALKRVTQLYVSIDASNRESLRKIDRPLHRDFWERFNTCLDILREKRFVQRTVFRLTLVKGFNIDSEVQGYADLVAKGLPCFVEIKGVTYCGTSTSSSAGLTMANVPFYEEVTAFVEALNNALEERGLEYGIAAEHAHSCCVLIASRRFWREGKWMTRIDYQRFFELLEGEREDWGPEDYCAETPEWAGWGRGGFDPRDERVDRKGRPKEEKKVEAKTEREGDAIAF